MPYSPNIPQPGDIPAQSQALILQNFQYLNSFVQGNSNALLLTRQSVAPTVGATQVAIYNLLDGTNSTLMIKNGAAAPVDILTAGKANNGWCILPCGIQLVWGSLVVTGHSNDTFTFPKAFSAVAYMVQVTGKYSAGMNQAFYTAIPTSTDVVVYNTNVNTMSAYIFAIGPA